ncbi:hypothetical protein ACTFIU_007445 [Dictyostelium citrinum]
MLKSSKLNLISSLLHNNFKHTSILRNNNGIFYYSTTTTTTTTATKTTTTTAINNKNLNLQNIKGTYDLFPNEQRIHKFIFDVGRGVAERYGFKEISTPIIEPFELFNRSVGESSDIVMKEMFKFKDYSNETSAGSQSSMICLRPEGTAGVIRAIINQSSTNHLTPTQRYYYQGPMFRYERPQRGRQRQFHQLGVELIGDQHPRSDVEIIDMAMNFVERLGIDKSNTLLKINSLGDIDSIKAYNEALKKFYTDNVNKLSPISMKRLERDNSLRILDSKEKQDIELNKLAPSIQDSLSTKCKDRFNQVLKGLDCLGISYEIDQSLVRGLDYYRHTIFEIQIIDNNNNNNNNNKNKQQGLAILGGGRYDGLANQLGYKYKEILPSIGWASGIERMVLFLDQSKIQNSIRPIGIAITHSSLSENAFKMCSDLRRNGWSSMLSTYNLEDDNISKQLKKFKNDPAFVIILAPSEYSNNTVIIKNMDDSTQSIIPLNEIDNFLENNKVLKN